MAAFVADSSVVAAWLLPDERDEKTVALLDIVGKDGATAPYLLWYEVTNLLIVALRRGRLEANEIEQRFGFFEDLAVKIVEPTDKKQIFLLAGKYGVSGYDATFLALALELSLPLATTDKKLLAAARSEGVRTLPEV